MSSRRDCLLSRTSLRVLALAILAGMTVGCGGQPASAPDQASVAVGAAEDAEAAVEALAPSAYEASLPEAVRERVSVKFSGDLDEMVSRRLVRMGVAANRTFYFVDKGTQRGAAYEMGVALEKHLNETMKTTPATKINVVFLPIPRDQMAAALTEGKVDLVVAQAIVRPELQAIVDFTDPVRENVSEVVVSGLGGPPIATVDDLSGKDVYARKDSSAWASLVELNGKLEAKGLAPVSIREVPGNLEDDDLLEMANAGIIPLLVVHDYLAEFWKKIFTAITVHDTVAVRTGATIAIPIRKNSPKLAAELNGFVAKNGLGTAFGNIVAKRYLENTSFAKSATSEAERRKFTELVELFKKYGDQYQVDYLLMAAQGYQESGLDQGVKSPVGAIGVMQVMPATAKDLDVGDVNQTEANIHAGVKYMRFMIDRYYKDEPMDQLNKALFTFASYNAGPARVRRLREESATRGLDPNLWFGNVEQIASERIGRETVTYVANIYKYYIAYKLIMEERVRRDEAKQAIEGKANGSR